MSYKNTQLARNPVAFWTFSDLTDSGPNGLNLTANGSPTFGVPSLLAGDTSTAVSLPGGNVGFNLPDSSLLNIGTGDFGFEIWLKTSDTSNQVLLAIGASDYLGIINGKASYDGSPNPKAVTDGAVHQFAITRTAGSMQAYCDGSTNGDAFESSGDLGKIGAIGRFPAYGALAFHGVMQYASFFNRALTPSEISENYTAGTTSSEPPTTSTLAPAGNIVLVAAKPTGLTLRAPYSGGNAPLSFQWKRSPVGGAYANLTDGAGVSGSTTDTLVDNSSLTAGQLYLYQCTVSDNFTSFQSYGRPAQLGLAPETFVAMGDSQSVGPGGGSEPNLAAIYHAADTVTEFSPRVRNIQVFNGSVAGTYSSDWVSTAGGSRYANAKALAGASFTGCRVFIRLGANDAQFGRSGADLKTNLQTIINNCLADGAIAVYLSYPVFRDPGLYGQDGFTIFDDGYLGRVLAFLPFIDSLVNNTTIFAGDRISLFQTMQTPQIYMYYSPGTPTTTPGTIHPGERGTELQGYQEGLAYLQSQNLLGSSTPTPTPTPTPTTGLTQEDVASLLDQKFPSGLMAKLNSIESIPHLADAAGLWTGFHIVQNGICRNFSREGLEIDRHSANDRTSVDTSHAGEPA